jgi:hypothetical protein
MANSKRPSSGMIAAEPAPIDLNWSTTALVIIDMQRDFMEPGGFAKRWATMSRSLRAR